METFSFGAAYPLVDVERSGFVESRHLGAAVVLSPDGGLLCEFGDVFSPIFPRSALKALQAVAVLRSGVSLEGAELAVAAASHRGTSEHMLLVRGVLGRGGFGELDLLCGAAYPLDFDSYREFLVLGREKSALAMTCSGKHASFLLACLENGWDVGSYLDVGHPLQLAIRGTVEEYVEEDVFHIGVDGCGAPVFAVSLVGLARGIRKVAQGVGCVGSEFAARSVARAVYDNGWVVEGRGHVDTVIIEDLGVFAKTGVEGVLVLGSPVGHTVALKVLDGSVRAAALAGLTILDRFESFDPVMLEKVMSRIVPPVVGGGEVVGGLRVSAELLRDLAEGNV